MNTDINHIGLFETMRVSKGRILLEDYHFERLYRGMQAMHLDHPGLFSRQSLKEEIIDACSKNGHEPGARVRVKVFSKDNEPQQIIETWQLDDNYFFNEPGLIIGVFNNDRKKIDEYSPYKTIQYEPYRTAAAFAANQHWDDCLVLNEYGNICDSSISNIFWINNKVIYTPPLSEGCIQGVMRQYLLNTLPASGFYTEEKPLHIEDLASANEIFLTNVIRGIRPVRNFNDMQYNQQLSREIFTILVGPLTNS